MSNKARIAQALAGAGSPAEYDSEGLQQPAIDPVAILAGLLGPGMVRAASGAMGSVARSAPRMLANEAGAIFPESTAPELLPEIAAGAKTGDPHALFAFHDNWGPGMTKRAMYNIFGDPGHPAIQKAGFGSTLPLEELKKLGIPIVGREAGRAFK